MYIRHIKIVTTYRVVQKHADDGRRSSSSPAEFAELGEWFLHEIHCKFHTEKVIIVGGITTGIDNELG